MHIDSKEKIASVPILRVRDFLARNKDFDAEFIRECLSISKLAAERLIQELMARDWVALKNDKHPRDPATHTTTQDGETFCAASASRQLTRKRAEQLIANVIQRAEEINLDPKYSDYVETLQLFGSMLTDVERLSDVDIAVELGCRYQDREEYHRAFWQRARLAPSNSNISVKVGWHLTEIYRALKGRSTGISIHDWQTEASLLEGKSRKVIFQAWIVALPARFPTRHAIPGEE